MAQKKMTEGKGRGRPRTYDPQTALGQALDVFWNVGYSGASLDSIATAAGMNRPSLYAAFGDKHALYIKALEQYWALASAAVHEALMDDELTLEEALLRFYEGQLAIYFSGDGQARGCFVIGTAMTEAAEDIEIRGILSDRLGTLDTELEQRLRSAINVGELKDDADPVALAALASAMLHSIAIRARAGTPREELVRLARSTVSMICK